MLISLDAARAAGRSTEGREKRCLTVKGRTQSVDVVVEQVGPAVV